MSKDVAGLAATSAGVSLWLRAGFGFAVDFTFLLGCAALRFLLVDGMVDRYALSFRLDTSSIMAESSANEAGGFAAARGTSSGVFCPVGNKHTGQPFSVR